MERLNLVKHLLLTSVMVFAGVDSAWGEDCTDAVNPASPVITSGFGFNTSNTRNQPNSSISADNVHNLSLQYTIVDAGEQSRRGAAAATDQVIYFSKINSIEAVNRNTGCKYWSYEHNSEAIRSASVLLLDNHSLGKRMVVFGTQKAQVVALDAVTGARLWSASAANNLTYSMITGGMQYYDGKLFVPVATNEVALAILEPLCCFTHGALVVFNADNGEVVWDYQTTGIALPLLPNLFKYGPSGVSIWSTPLIDPERGHVLVGTSQNLAKPLTQNSDSVVALDINTGDVAWMFKGTAEDFYNATCGVEGLPFNHCQEPANDFDMITPILTTTPSGQQVIIAGDKAGYVYSLDPGNGSLNWSTKVGHGSILGGIHWAMAVDSDRVYAAVTDLYVPKTAILDSLLGTDLFSVTPEIVVDGIPGIYALNVETGVVEWEVHDVHLYEDAFYQTIYSAGLTITNDVLFAGSLDGVVKAFNSADGTELWSFDTAIDVVDVYGNIGNGGTIDSVGPVVAGKNVIVNSGYNIFSIGHKSQYQGGPGNGLFVFGLQ